MGAIGGRGIDVDREFLMVNVTRPSLAGSKRKAVRPIIGDRRATEVDGPCVTALGLDQHRKRWLVGRRYQDDRGTSYRYVRLSLDECRPGRG